MTAFVTGGGGFIGRHLVRVLRRADIEVRALARSEASAGRLRAAGCEVVVGDVLDPAALRSAAPIVRRIGPDLGEIVRASAGVTYWASDAKARRELGYAPRDLEAGLTATFAR